MDSHLFQGAYDEIERRKRVPTNSADINVVKTFEKDLNGGTSKGSEKDPTGRDLKAGGAKADAGKVDVTRGAFHYFPRAIKAVAELSGIGAAKYSWKGWESVPDGIHRYGAAMGRHELAIEDDFTRRDPETGVLEVTAQTWNSLARLELVLREQEKS